MSQHSFQEKPVRKRFSLYLMWLNHFK